jgi:aquaporin Z
VNPARSTGPALIVGGLALQQLWLFWIAPLVGGVVGGLAYRTLFAEAPAKPDITGTAGALPGAGA